ncbi:MAG: DNA polymerase III subunit gamma/tau [Lachnospiraceae bacterium]|nr:DNA polymerase III subunit gamma/tau [Lachnospiraceae bacterium]
MSYTAFYRKFRPATFEEVKGQDNIVTTLKNQIQVRRIGHAYLFGGSHGTGKTTVGKIFAKAVNCEHPLEGSPCNECSFCQAIQAGISTNVIEIDAASNNGVDNIREIREEVSYRPPQGSYKVYIIDEVHMLSTGAVNALLKTLEEPPEYVIFILATTEIYKIPVTILSRCQRYDFKRLSIDIIAKRLMELMQQEGIEVEEQGVRYVAKVADGSMRDALSLLDQCIVFYLGKSLTYDRIFHLLGTVDTEVLSQLLRRVIVQDVSGSIRILEELVLQGKKIEQFVNDFTWYMRNLMLVSSSDYLEDILDVSTENLKQLLEESMLIDSDTLMRYIRIFSELSGQIRYSAQKRILVEIALIRLCRPQMETNLDAVLDRIRVLEKKAEQGVFDAASAQPESIRVTEAEKVKKQAFPVIQKTVPLNLQKIRNEWKKIIDQITQPLKNYLRGSVLKYDSDKEYSRLFIEFSDRTAYFYVNRPEKIEEIKAAIRRVIGCDTQVGIVLANWENCRDLVKISVEEIIQEKIHMSVVVEDEPEEEFE